MRRQSARSTAGRNRLQLATMPRIYRAVDDVRPDENQGHENPAVLFTAGLQSIPSDLSSNVLKFLAMVDLRTVAQVSTAALYVVWDCKALLFDAVQAQLDDLREFPISLSRTQRGTNMHGFRKKNRVRSRINGVWVDGYIVAVTTKYVHYVRYDDVFNVNPPSIKVKSERGIVHVRPYVGVITEVVSPSIVDPRYSGRRVCSHDGCTNCTTNGGVCGTHSNGDDAV